MAFDTRNPDKVHWEKLPGAAKRTILDTPFEHVDIYMTGSRKRWMRATPGTNLANGHPDRFSVYRVNPKHYRPTSIKLSTLMR